MDSPRLSSLKLKKIEDPCQRSTKKVKTKDPTEIEGTEGIISPKKGDQSTPSASPDSVSYRETLLKSFRQEYEGFDCHEEGYPEDLPSDQAQEAPLTQDTNEGTTVMVEDPPSPETVDPKLHHQDSSSQDPKPVPAVLDSVQDGTQFGPWMIAKKRPRNKKSVKAQDPHEPKAAHVQDQHHGSRFQILEIEPSNVSSFVPEKPPPRLPAPNNLPKPPQISSRVRKPLGGRIPNMAEKPSTPKVAEHKDHQLVFQIMRQIQDQMRNEGSLFLLGTKVFGPGKEELCYLQNFSPTLHDPGPVHPLSQHQESDCVMPSVSADEHMDPAANQATSNPS
ncbi:hypothetical protein SESBI_43920 [Sesbania bispinosa]|nr:hypothetical protein SESBI_43920 [Sesbania bispinosa]